jgi:hypothetical protein
MSALSCSSFGAKTLWIHSPLINPDNVPKNEGVVVEVVKERLASALNIVCGSVSVSSAEYNKQVKDLLAKVHADIRYLALKMDVEDCEQSRIQIHRH